MKQRALKVFTMFILTAALIFTGQGLAVMDVYADDGSGTIKEFTMEVKYGQTEARKMLSMVNNFRASGADAWAWNSGNTKKVQYYGDDLVYDYVLEKVAMKRAAEIAIKYSHTRPDGTDCYTAYPDAYENASKGENIAYGEDGMFSKAEDVFTAWREDNEDYYGQGHRRNMLNGEFRAIGIGHVVYNGMDFWVQEFSSEIVGRDRQDANDAKTSVRLRAEQSLAEKYGSSLSDPSGDENDEYADLIKEEDTTRYRSGDYSYTLDPDGEATLVYWWGGSSSDIEIPSAIDGHKVAELGSMLFYNTGITSVYIPSTIRYIESDAFSYCPYMKSFSVAPNNKLYKDDNGVLYNKGMSKLYFYPAQRTTSEYHVPEDVEHINCTAFAYADIGTLYLDDPNTTWAMYTFYGDTFKVIYKRGGYAEQLATNGYNYGPEFEGVGEPAPAMPEDDNSSQAVRDHSDITDPNVLQEIYNFEEDIDFLSLMVNRGLTVGDATNVGIVRMHYDWLSDEAKAAICEEDMALLENAERQIAWLEEEQEQQQQTYDRSIPPGQKSDTDIPQADSSPSAGDNTGTDDSSGTGDEPSSGDNTGADTGTDTGDNPSAGDPSDGYTYDRTATVEYASSDKVVYGGSRSYPKLLIFDDETGDNLSEDEYLVSTDGGTKIGKHKLTVYFFGEYSNMSDETKTFRIVPGKAKIKSVTAKKKKAVLKIRKQGGGVKYKVQYRVKGSKKWKTKTTSKTTVTIKKLKSGKRYQFRVCAYKKRGETYQGSWSKISTKKIK